MFVMVYTMQTDMQMFEERMPQIVSKQMTDGLTVKGTVIPMGH